MMALHKVWVELSIQIFNVGKNTKALLRNLIPTYFCAVFQITDKILQVQSVDSTNNYIAKLYREGKVSVGSAVMAEFQESGKGQMGNVWESEPGKNVLISFLLPGFGLKPENSFIISKWFAVCLHAYLQKQFRIACLVKWPNDIVTEQGKLGGILIESSLAGKQYQSHVIGLGLNVGQADFAEGINGTSLLMETGKTVRPLEVALGLIETMNKWSSLMELGQFEKIEQLYWNVLWNKGEHVVQDEVAKMQRTIRVKEVTKKGELIAEDVNNQSPLSYSLKELKWLV